MSAIDRENAAVAWTAIVALRRLAANECLPHYGHSAVEATADFLERRAGPRRMQVVESGRPRSISPNTSAGSDRDPSVPPFTGAEFGRRRSVGTPLCELLQPSVYHRLYEANFITLEEVAQRSRAVIADVPGVGSTTLAKLDAAIAERGLSYGSNGRKLRAV